MCCHVWVVDCTSVGVSSHQHGGSIERFFPLHGIGDPETRPTDGCKERGGCMQKLRTHGENTDNSDIVNAPEPFFFRYLRLLFAACLLELGVVRDCHAKFVLQDQDNSEYLVLSCLLMHYYSSFPLCSTRYSSYRLKMYLSSLVSSNERHRAAFCSSLRAHFPPLLPACLPLVCLKLPRLSALTRSSLSIHLIFL